jgi:hypothetical protein
MTEPDVTITDYLLAAEALTFAVLLARSTSGTALRGWFVLFFVATAIASLAGGSVHGFFPTSGPAEAGPYVIGNVLWRTVLLALGVVSASAWAIGARLLFAERTAFFVTTAAWVEFALYACLVIFVTDAFLLAIVNYLPSTLFLIAAFFAHYRTSPATPILVGLIGLILTLVAAAVQRAGIGFPHFNHNALYHLLQGVALLLIFEAARLLARA